jgi:hypothetical protein
LKQTDPNLKALDTDRPMHNIETLSLSPNYQKMICVTRRSQLFWAPLAEMPKMLLVRDITTFRRLHWPRFKEIMMNLLFIDAGSDSF